MSVHDQQCRYENEGACAFFAGFARDECPHDEKTDSVAYNFWLCGYDNARGEKQALERGTITFSLLDQEAQRKPKPEYKVIGEVVKTTEQAYREGLWKPRFAKVPAAWRKPA